eukprot:5428543-Amphidinium_carterae.1
MAHLMQELVVDPLSVTRPHDTLRMCLTRELLDELVPVAINFKAEVAERPGGPALPLRVHEWRWQLGRRPGHFGMAFQECIEEFELWRRQWGCKEQPARGRGHAVRYMPLKDIVKVGRAFESAE